MLRSSLTLSLVTGKSVELTNIRAKRSNPGLAKQHLTAVQAAAEIGSATLTGASLRSQHLVFEPGELAPGDYHFRIGTAGSCNLVLQTLVPALMTLDQPSKVTVEGGTHNHQSPPFDFVERVYVPQLNRLRGRVLSQLHRRGFYPIGGGQASIHISPTGPWRGLSILERGDLKCRNIESIVSQLPMHIANRELNTLLRKAGWGKHATITAIEDRDALGPGNFVSVSLEYDRVTELFSGFGRLGVRAEQVAKEAWDEAKRYLAGTYPVGKHLADQLMLPMALAALAGQRSEFLTTTLTQHSLTHIEIIRAFLDVEISHQQVDDDVRIVIG